MSKKCIIASCLRQQLEHISFVQPKTHNTDYSILNQKRRPAHIFINQQTSAQEHSTQQEAKNASFENTPKKALLGAGKNQPGAREVLMSDDEITAELHDMNDTLLESMATRDATINIGEFGILTAHDTDTS